MEKSEEDDVETTGACGWGPCRPPILQSLASVWSFIVFYLGFAFTHGIQSSYTISVITTLERRFNFPSAMSGILVSICTVGYLASVIFVSFFCSNKHQPRLFSLCMLLMSLCAMLYVIPHFVYGAGDDYHQYNEIERVQNSFKNRSMASSLCRLDGDDTTSASNETCLKQDATDTRQDGREFLAPALVLFIISEIIQGVCGAPVWTVGIAYVDDNTNPDLSAKLIGVMFLTRFLSPVVSFAFGAVFLRISADLKESSLTPDDPHWIGAWWLGFLVCFIINFIIFIPASMLPSRLKSIKNLDKSLPLENAGAVSNNEKDKSNLNPAINSKNVKDLPKAVLHILYNPVFLSSTAAVCADLFLLGYIAFLPKYIEVHFQQTAWSASLLGGMVPAGCGALVSYLSGIVSAKLKGADDGVTASAGFSFIMSVIGLVLIIPVWFMPCSNIQLNGFGNSVPTVLECSENCSCSADVFDPVCGSGVVYYSPCHAGCLHVADGFHNDTTLVYRECSCVQDDVANTGLCTDECAFLIPYVIGTALLFMAGNMYNVPITNVVLRCVREEEKSLALGIQTFAISLLIFPAPVVYGAIIDSTCLLWKTTSCSDDEGACLLYDRNDFRLKFHGLAAVFKAIATILYFVSYLYARRILRNLPTAKTFESINNREIIQKTKF